MEINDRLYRSMLLIRRFEERLLSEFSTGRIVGTTHAYTGQEADAAGVFDITSPDDIVFSNHRCHGHFLAYGGDPYLLAAEVMGKATGLVGGRGGSQHIHWRNFYSNGIQGGIVPIATGMAFAEKMAKSNAIVLVFLGDGTFGEGVVYESLNLASVWALPILFVVENNHYAQTTPTKLTTAGTFEDRFHAFNIPIWHLDSTDVVLVRNEAEKAVKHVRGNKRPAGLILDTHRFAAHSKGDDFRDEKEIASFHKIDPLLIHKLRCREEDIERAELDVRSLVDAAFARADLDPYPALENLEPILP